MEGIEADLQPDEIGPRAIVAADLVEAVASRYGLADARIVKDLGGTYNLNLHLKADRGDYILRVYRPWVTAARLECIQDTKASLRSAGLPVVVPVASLAGETIMRVDSRVAELEPFLPHDPAVHTWDAYRTSFCLLGTLHDALPQCIPPSFVPPRVSNYGTTFQLLTWLKRTADRLAAYDGGTAVEDGIELCREATGIVRESEEKIRTIAPALPVQAVHGDYRLGNVVFRAGTVVGILDFDFLAIRPRLYEIAYAIYWMLVAFNPDGGYGNGCWTQIKGLLDEYDTATRSPLTGEERRALPFMLARIPVYWVAEAAFLPDPALALTEAAKGLELGRQILRRAEEMARAL